HRPGPFSHIDRCPCLTSSCLSIATSTRRCYAAWSRSLSCRPIQQRMADDSRIEHPIHRASHGGGSEVQDVRVNHGGAHVTVPGPLLDGPDVATLLEQVGRE